MIFHLHPTFDVPTREIVQPPFEINEIGWGEFEFSVTLYFKDESEAPIEMKHVLKLFPPDFLPDTPLNTKQVVNESYDEIVFTDPSLEFKQCLMMYKPPIKREKTDIEVIYLYVSTSYHFYSLYYFRNFIINLTMRTT